jgi:hypothetical protein
MVCEACGGRTQPETVIVVRRTLGALRSTKKAAWYCWTCKSSTRQTRMPGSLPAGVLRANPPRAPLGT